MADKAAAKVNPIMAQKYLKGVKYPASKQDLLKIAKSLNADEHVMTALKGIPEKSYQGPTDVTKAIGEFNKS